MGRTVFAEERHLKYLQNFGGPDVYTIGLILGQSKLQKDYVVHLARTSPIAEEDLNDRKSNVLQDSTENYITSIKDIDASLVADHAKHVTRMLPGGMWVLGIFIVGPGDCLSDSRCLQKLKAVLVTIRRSLTINIYLDGNANQESLILNFNSINQQYSSKSVEVSQAGIVKPAEWKFQKKIAKWYQLETFVEFDYLLPVTESESPHTLKNQLQGILKQVSEMVDSVLVVIEGKPRNLNETIEEIVVQKKSKKDRKTEEENEGRVLQAEVYLPYALKNEKASVDSILCKASMRLIGQIISRTCVHENSTIEESTSAIKRDILRSLGSRLELHWDSLIEDENGSPEENVILHELPRRVLVDLPDTKITLSDYLFPGEGPNESLAVLKEILDVDIRECQVQKDVEFQVDPTEFYNQNDVKTTGVDLSKESGANSQLAFYIAGIIVSFVIAIIAFLVHQLSSQGKKS